MTRARVLTVTLNPAIDQTISISDFAAGKVNRVKATQSHPAGKGVNVATVLDDLGIKTIVTGFLGLDNARLFDELFASRQMEDAFIRIPGETRTGLKIIDEVSHDTTDINFPGLTPGPGDVSALLEKLSSITPTGGWVVLAGSLPGNVDATLYRQLIEHVHASGAKVVLDTSSASLKTAVRARPEVVKPNHAELNELAGSDLKSPAEIVSAARSLLIEQGIQLAVISLGGDGALFITETQALHATPPAVTVKSTVGAGDTMVAGIVYAQLQQMPLEEIARIATAMGAHAVTRIGAGLDSADAWKPLADKVRIETRSL